MMEEAVLRGTVHAVRPGGQRGYRAVILCRVYRTAAAAWGITSVDVKHASADTARGLVPTAQKHYREFPPATWEC
ncbi:hypothetical protein DIPPA_35568 [Diplonema papillatum]|nr:hypothetical protein DIPPA_35568 [Diplonema papillatum]